MEIISGGVTAPIGFLAAGMHAGVRKNKKKKDEEVEEIKDQIALLFIKNIMKKISVEKLVQKEEFPFNDVNKLYNFMLKRYFVNREMREAGQKFKA